jgi:glycosyltransferase involved in cell wall biosynthesis
MQESKHKYSFIIPCYTASEEDFRRCLDYIKNQTIKPHEVICIDDCSPVETPKIALEYGFKYIRHDINKHNGGARNTGIREATGDYLIFCNSDDYFELNTIEEIDKVNNGEDLIIVGFSVFGTVNKKDRFIPSKETTPNISKYNWNGEAMHVVRRQFILDNNLFEIENVPIADKDWSERVEKVIKSFSFVPKALYNYQWGHEGAIMTQISKGEIVSNLTNPKYYDTNDKNIDIIVYEHAIPKIGGNTTSLINWCKHMSKYYNITVLYKDCDSYRLSQLKKYAICQRYTGQNFECDKLMWNSSWGEYPSTIKYKGKPIQMLHANYQEVYKSTGFRYKIPQVETEHISVSNHVREVFKEMYSIDSTVVPNMLDPEIKIDKVLRLITCSRLTEQKGLKRIIKFTNELKKRNKKFIWFIYGEGNDTSSINLIKNISEIVLMPVSFDLPSYLADADYLIHFSDTEGDPYCTKEALQVNTPCITTNYPATYEQITDGKNGYILDFALFENGTEKEWDEVIKKIYNKIPKFNYECKDEELEQTWIKILGKPKGKLKNIEEENNMKYLVEALNTYEERKIEDGVLKRIPDVGEQFEVDKERLNILLGDNAYKVAFVKLVKENKEEIKGSVIAQPYQPLPYKNEKTNHKTTTKKKVTKKK